LGSALIDGVSPYSFSVSYPPAAVVLYLIGMPFDQVFFGRVSLLGIALSIATLVWFLLGGLTSKLTLLAALVVICLLSAPFLATIDRGNLQSLVTVLLGITLILQARDRNMAANFFIGLMAALKIFPVLLMLGAIAKDQWRRAAVVVGCVIAASLLLFSLFPGGFLTNSLSFFRAATSFTGEADPLKNYSTKGMIQQGFASASNLLGQTGVMESSPWIWVSAGAVWVISVLYLLRRGKLPSWVLGTLMLASLQVVPPISFAYTATWAIFASAWFLSSRKFPRYGTSMCDETTIVPMNLIFIFCMVVTLSPLGIFLNIDGQVLGLQAFLSPFSLWILLILALVYDRLPANPVMKVPISSS
jgi:hypothetical protein